MDIKVSEWEIPGSDGRPIYGNMHKRTSGLCKGVFIVCHGFKGYKDYGFIPTLCNRVAEQGLVALRFNFSHSGMTHNHERFEHPDLFERDTWGRQIEDLESLVRHKAMPIASHEFVPIVLFGHSRGGVTSTLFASRFKHIEHIGGLITAAAPDYACKMDDLVRDQLRAEGRLLSPSGRTGQKLYVGLDWLEEIERDTELYDPVLAAADVKCPMLILHGDEDDTVPLGCAESLHRAATPNSTLEIIGGANHVFNCPNPVPENTLYNELPEQTQQMIDKSVSFTVRCCENARGA